jgi:hypothetical protein
MPVVYLAVGGSLRYSMLFGKHRKTHTSDWCVTLCLPFHFYPMRLGYLFTAWLV